MLSIIYTLITLAVLPVALLYHWYRSISRGRKSAFGERFGSLPVAAAKALDGKPVIWLHAVSVGEVIAARPLLKGLRRNYGKHRLLLSVTTETGRTVAEADGLSDAVIYFPFDILLAVRRLLAAVAPDVIIIMETEIWPVFTQEANRRNIPLLLANGRISDRSFPRYRRFAWFFQPILQQFTFIGMQSDADREKIIAIGAPPERTQVLGNLKYDIPYSGVTTEERFRLRDSYRIPADLMVLVAGSTHPGEEELLLPIYRNLLEQFEQLLLVLVLVPRHPERAVQVEELLIKAGFDVTRRSSLAIQQQHCAAGSVVLVDTIGELMQFYAQADLAYVGGSLVPTGGHNLLEPASRGIPLVFGPHMGNFREVAALTLEYGAGLQVQTPDQLAECLAELLDQPEKGKMMGEQGLKLLATCGGSIHRHLEAVARVLKP